MPAGNRVERPGLDGPQHLGHQAEEPPRRRTIPLGPVAVELRLPRLGQDVEAEAADSEPSRPVITYGSTQIEGGAVEDEEIARFEAVGRTPARKAIGARPGSARP
jgi:hypothetical protein